MSGLGSGLKVLVICHGNVCRSPFAGEILRRVLGADRVRDKGVGSHDEVAPGRRCPDKVITFARDMGYDLTQHRSARVTQDDIDWADIVVYMDERNRKRLEAYDRVEGKLMSLGDGIGVGSIPDPNMLADRMRVNQALALLFAATLRLSFLAATSGVDLCRS